MALRRGRARAQCCSWKRLALALLAVLVLTLLAENVSTGGFWVLYSDFWKRSRAPEELRLELNDGSTASPAVKKSLPRVTVAPPLSAAPPTPVPVPVTSTAAKPSTTVLAKPVTVLPTTPPTLRVTRAVTTTVVGPGPPPVVHIPVVTEMWIFCAQQWQTCGCEGMVRWGNTDKWIYIVPKPGETTVVVDCSIRKLPDLIPGDDFKHCQCQTTPGSPFFERLNPAFLPDEHSRLRPFQVASCELFYKERELGECWQHEWKAVEPFCSESWSPPKGGEAGEAGVKALTKASLRSLMRAWVEPRFWGNYQRFYNSSGWLKQGFVNYYAGPKHEEMTEELIKSVHLFSTKPIVVVHFGFYTPSSWNASVFPRLVLLNAPPQPPSAMRSFHFNKLRAFILARVLTGVELDSDQFVAPGVDALFPLTEKEITRDYPFPILPAHFYPFSHPGGNLGGTALWKRYCPEKSCLWQTVRWGHAHPTWTFWALPFVGRWLRKQLRDEMLAEAKGGKMPALRVLDVKEDEDMLNVGTWEEGGTKQWCKFDLADPVEFETILRAGANQSSCPKGATCNNVVSDTSFNPIGIAKVFYTAHHAVQPNVTRKYVSALVEKVRKKDMPPPIMFNGHFYESGEALRKAHPLIKCII